MLLANVGGLSGAAHENWLWSLFFAFTYLGLLE